MMPMIKIGLQRVSVLGGEDKLVESCLDDIFKRDI